MSSMYGPGPGDEATWPPYTGHPNDPRGTDDTYEPDYDDLNDCMDDSPYCECDLEPTEEEEMSNTCASCGKLLS